MTSAEWTQEDSFQARLEFVMQSDEFPSTGCSHLKECTCTGCAP